MPLSPTGRPETGGGARPPLHGLRVVVTRPVHQAEALCAAFGAAGATVERLPLIAVLPPADPEPLRRAAARLDRYSWVAFTSRNAVTALVDAAGALPPDLRAAAIGLATARSVRDADVEPALVSAGGTGAELARELAAAEPGEPSSAGPVLLPLASDARPDLREGLEGAGFAVEVVTAYDKRAPDGAVERARVLFAPDAPLGWVTFTSPRIARTFAEVVDGIAEGSAPGWEERRSTLLAASIGSTTSGALRRLGVEPAAEAETPGNRELVEAVVRAVRV